MKKQKIILEYALAATTKSIFRAVSTSPGLCEWFADDVDITGSTYTIYWNKIPHIAHMVSKKENQHLRLRWSDQTDCYFEFKIVKNELTNANTLIVTDFAEVSECQESIELWNNQIEKLKRSIGCLKN